MSFKRFRRLVVMPIVFILSSIVFACISLKFNRLLAYTELTVVGALLIMYFAWLAVSVKDLIHVILHVSSRTDASKRKSVASCPLPVVVTDKSGNIVLFNEAFSEEVMKVDDEDSANLFAYLPETSVSLESGANLSVTCNDRYYNVFYDETKHKDSLLRVYYFIDETDLRLTETEYLLSRPQIMILTIDGFNEIQKNYTNNDFTGIRMGIDRIINEWVAKYNTCYGQMSSERYIIFAETRNLEAMKEEKFKLLDEIRNFTFRDQRVGVTISVGVGTGNSFEECESNARQALDMAQSRGGDQVAVRAEDGSYIFYGGIAKGIEKTTKVRTRIVASSVAELIGNSKNVMIMGHRFPDLDAMGAAVAMYSAAVSMGVPAYIVTDREKSLAGPLLDRMDEENFKILKPSQSVEKMSDDTLLIIVDTHIVDFVEVPELYKKAKKVVVIDHHRKAVNFIDKAVIFFHDPAVSSASEMVTELLQYIGGEPIIGKFEADALLAGITLDTRNFVLRAGVRTFEAAAYLKSRGADTVRVKKLFSSTLENYKQKNTVISASNEYKNCAIARAQVDSKDIRIIASQAADELLNITQVDASFVLFESGDVINISARSLGLVNVQIIMEKLGGGGHQTMAAAQIQKTTFDEAEKKLREAIDLFYEG